MSTTFLITYAQMTCIKCSAVFALNSEFVDRAKRESGGFHCPHCQQRQGWWTSDADRLKKQLADKDRELREEKCATLRQKQIAEEAAEMAAKAQRKLKRVDRGVCPCCNRSFSNLARHMATQHSSKKSRAAKKEEHLRKSTENHTPDAGKMVAKT